MLTPDQVRAIDLQQAQDRHRIQAIELDGERVIVKQQEAPRRKRGYLLLNIVAGLLRQPIMRAVPAPGGAAAQAIEVARLRALAAAGAPVPAVLHVAERWFAMSAEGERTLDHLLRRGPGNPADGWEAGLAAILALHRRGQNASQCFARNMMWDDGKISFIDFEDDPAAALTLPCAQARDWLLYLHSTAWLRVRDPAGMAQRLMHYLMQEPPQVRDVVLRAMRYLSWLRILPQQRKPWGRDVIAMQAAAAVAYRMKMPG